jgi:hypothetical protein
MPKVECTARRCEHGWVSVGSSYVEREAKVPPHIASEDPAVRAEAEKLYAQARAAVANSVYPCRECNAPTFFRWAAGHLDSAHNRAGCEDCQEVRRGRQPKSAGSAGDAFEPRERRDLT